MNRMVLILLVCLSLLFVFLLSFYIIDDYEVKGITAEACCGGSYCTDTYYDAETNLCHLTLCENLLFKKNCTYEGYLE